MTDLDNAILGSIWTRLQWDFLFQNPQLEEWLQGSTLQATDEMEDGKPVYRLFVADHADWLDAHAFTICRGLSVEMQRPVVVRVVAQEAR